MGIVADAQVELNWAQQQDVPVDGAFNVYSAPAGQALGYSNRLNASAIPAWPDGEGKIGWGLGGWGADPWGLGPAGLGFGGGGWGGDCWGIGAEPMSFDTVQLDDGAYQFAVVGLDAPGNQVTPADMIVTATVAGTPAPPGVPEPTDYDDGTDTLSLAWALSADDEG